MSKELEQGIIYSALSKNYRYCLIAPLLTQYLLNINAHLLSSADRSNTESQTK